MKAVNDSHEAGKEKIKVNFMKQRTLKSAINCTGISLHSGIKVSMTLKPAAPDHGIVFKRTDIAGRDARISANWRNVTDTLMCTVLGNDEGVKISTIEHLMAALSGCRIDNALIEINGSEVPAMDGSSLPFVFLIECAGILEQDAPRQAIRILAPIGVSDGRRQVCLAPSRDFSLNFEIDFDSPAVARQSLGITMADGIFKKELACARTFGFLHEVEKLHAAGLARGGSLDNAVVVSGEKILNEDGLRYSDEFVRHKILDAMGDLYLAGAPIIGNFSGTCSGHAMTVELLVRLFENPKAWTMDVVAEQDAAFTSSAGVWPDREAAGLAATA